MTIRTSPTEPQPTHHIKLSKSGTEVGLVLCNGRGEADPHAIERVPYPSSVTKMAMGDSKYSDREPPFKTIEQKNWIGGRAQEDFEDDQTKYYDGYRVDTTKKGRLILGGQETYARGHRDQNFTLPGSVRFVGLYSTTRFLDRTFTTTAAYNAWRAEFWIRRVGTPNSGITVEITSSDRLTVHKTKVIALADMLATDIVSRFQEFYFASAYAVSDATQYRIKIYATSASDDADNHWEVGCDADGNASSTGRSSDGTTWLSATYGLYFRVSDGAGRKKHIFFEYREQLYFVEDPDNGTSVSRLFMNGSCGYDDSTNTPGDTITDAAQTWTTDEWAGCIVKYIGNRLNDDGGYDQELNWAKIASNTGTVLTLETTLEQRGGSFVILGSDKWTQITTSSYITKQVKDVAIANNVVYFTQGEKTTMVKMRRLSDGTTHQFVKLGTGHKGHFIKAMTDPQHGTTLTWNRNIEDFDFDCEVYQTDAPAGWDTSTSLLDITLNADGEWDEQSVTYVSRTTNDENQPVIEVHTGVIYTVAGTPTAAGTGYSANDILDIVDGDAIGGKVKVLTVDTGGEVLTLELNAAGTGYSTGSGKVTTGGTGSGCTIEITAITGFSTGVMCSVALDAETDIRYCTKAIFMWWSSVALNTGDVQIVLDDDANCVSPFLALDIPGQPERKYYKKEISFDALDLTGADKTISVGLMLNLDLSTVSPTGVTHFFLYPTLVVSEKDRGPITVSKNGDKITGLEIYGDPETIWVFTERGMGEIRNYLYKPISLLRQMETVRGADNGVGHCVSDVYLYFSMMDGVERYYRQNLDDVGPNRDAGMPSGRQGPVSDMLSYPGRIYAAINGKRDNVSSVMCYNENGWFEIYRAPMVYKPIQKLHVQNIPGSYTQKLWISQGQDILWVPITLYPLNQTDYRYTHQGCLVTSKFSAGMSDVTKFWKSLKLVTNGLNTYLGWPSVIAQYRVEGGSSFWGEDADWEDIGTFDLSPSEEIDLSSDNDVTGKWIQFRLILETRDNTETPEVLAMVIEALMREMNKFAYRINFRLADRDNDLTGEPDLQTMSTKLTQLDGWVNSAAPVTMNSISDVFDSKTVFPEPVPLRPVRVVMLEDGREVHVCQMTLIEI